MSDEWPGVGGPVAVLVEEGEFPNGEQVVDPLAQRLLLVVDEEEVEDLWKAVTLEGL